MSPDLKDNGVLSLLPGYSPERDAAGCWFDADAAQHALDFFPECLVHVEGSLAGQPFVLQPWQQSFVANLFGWKQKDEFGRIVRRFRESLLYVPRKNGKTPLVAGLALYVLFCDPEEGQQNYVAAADREQAGMLFRHAQGMVQAQPWMRNSSRIYGGNAAAGQSRSIVLPKTGSFLRIVSADASTKHGGNSSLVVIDELHTQPSRDLVDVLTTSTASANRAQPLIVHITTADYDRPSICNEKHAYACAVRDGTNASGDPVSDPRFLPAIWEALESEDWTDPAVWAKANPNLGVSVSTDYLAREVAKAKANPAEEFALKRLHLNMKTSSLVKSVIPMDRWDAVGSTDPKGWRAAALERLKGCPCYAGLDLGSVSDLTAFVLLFGEADENADFVFTAVPWFWVPSGQAERRRHDRNTSYPEWIAQGWITETSGNETDYDQMRDDINRVVRDYPLMELAVDRALLGVKVCQDLMSKDGLNVIEFGQGYLSMAGPVREFLDLIARKGFRHGGNPVLRWMAGNVQGEASKRKDEEGKTQQVLKFVKASDTRKIDGIIAAVMALGRAMASGYGATPSFYTGR